MKSNMVIKVEFLAGTTIEEALNEAKAKASELNVAYIKFKFNGTSFSIGRNANIQSAIIDWEQGDGKYGICYS